MMHQHHAGHQHLHAELEKRQDSGTVIQYVYKTAAKNFDGPIGGYSTVNPPPADPTPAAQPQQNTQQQASSNNQQASSNNDNSEDNSEANANSDSKSESSSNSNSKSDSDSDDSSKSDSSSDDQQAQQDAAQKEADSSIAAAKSKMAEDASKSAVAAQAEKTAEAKSVEGDDSNTTTKAAAVGKPTTRNTATATAAETSATDIATPTDDSVSSPTASIAQSSASSTSTPASADSSSGGGLSGGAKAGIAFAVIFGIAAIAALIFLLYRRKKRQQNEAYQQANDEKSAAFGGGLARSQSSVSTRTTATAPRLSLRPVTQFSPDLVGKAKTAQTAGGAAGVGATSRGFENEKQDPFGDHAAQQQPKRVSDNMLPIQNNNPPENPFGNHAEAPAPMVPTGPGSAAANSDAPAPLRIRTPTPEAVAAAGGAGALVGAGAVAATKHNKPKDLHLQPDNRPITPSAASPAGSEFSHAPSSPGGPPPTNVHRVQLDFKPSMDDELELKAGALVRLLHEYDDGWALCIRLDRSQQGVTPRTCLSARPVKPRPPPGARGPGPRGPPQGMMGPGGPQAPGSPGMRGPGGPQRPSSPASGRGSPSPYNRQPQTNGSPRSMSPGPYGAQGQRRTADVPTKRRSNSASDVSGRRMSPPGPSPMNPAIQRVGMKEQAVAHPDRPASPAASIGRKPVPGQAM